MGFYIPKIVAYLLDPMQSILIQIKRLLAKVSGLQKLGPLEQARKPVAPAAANFGVCRAARALETGGLVPPTGRGGASVGKSGTRTRNNKPTTRSAQSQAVAEHGSG